VNLRAIRGLSDLVLCIFDDGSHATSYGQQVGAGLAHSGQERLAFLLHKRDTGEIDDDSPASGSVFRLQPAALEFMDPWTCETPLERNSRGIVRHMGRDF